MLRKPPPAAEPFRALRARNLKRVKNESKRSLPGPPVRGVQKVPKEPEKSQKRVRLVLVSRAAAGTVTSCFPDLVANVNNNYVNVSAAILSFCGEEGEGVGDVLLFFCFLIRSAEDVEEEAQAAFETQVHPLQVNVLGEKPLRNLSGLGMEAH